MHCHGELPFSYGMMGASSLMPWTNCGLLLNHVPPLKATIGSRASLLAQDILDLIERYVAISSAGQLPEWVQYLRAHREEAKQEEDGAPRKKAHREEAGQEEAGQEEAGQEEAGKRRQGKRRQGKRRQGKRRQGKRRQGKRRQGKGRQGKRSVQKWQSLSIYTWLP